MYCKYCGNQIDDDSIFCSSCGKKQNTFKVDISKSNFNNSDKYDLNYEKEWDATIYGICLLVINFIWAFITQFYISKNTISWADNLTLFSFASILVRIYITTWVVGISKRLNRDSLLWGFFGFLLPALAMIIIGQKKKLKLN